jgi:hypothetical protein
MEKLFLFDNSKHYYVQLYIDGDWINYFDNIPIYTENNKELVMFASYYGSSTRINQNGEVISLLETNKLIYNNKQLRILDNNNHVIFECNIDSNDIKHEFTNNEDDDSLKPSKLFNSLNVIDNSRKLTALVNFRNLPRHGNKYGYPVEISGIKIKL